MKIVVSVEHVPDAQGDRRFAGDGTVDRAGVDGLLSELDEYAVEEASKPAAARDGSVGPDAASDAVRKSLQMGADAGCTWWTTPGTGRTRSRRRWCVRSIE